MKKTMLGLTLLALCSATALAASHGPQNAHTQASKVIHRSADSDAGLKKIFTNLGPSTDAFDSSNGYFVMGDTNAAYGYSQDIAIPFTPKKNSTITKVKAALQYYDFGGGQTNAAILGIAKDASGLPGKIVAKKTLKNFQDFGSGCCKLATWNLKTPLAVKKKKQYWVVGTAQAKLPDVINTWDFVYNDAPGAFAFQQEEGGWILLTESDGYPPSATAVYGTIP